MVQLADEFIISNGDAYELTGVTVEGSMSDATEEQSNTTINQFIVEVYGNEASAPNDNDLIFSQVVQASFTADQRQVRLPLDPRPLGPGVYWLSVYAVSPIETARWNWATRSASGNEWSINDRSGFFNGVEADTWLSADELDFEGLDLVFSLEGNPLEGTIAPSGLSSELEGIQIALEWEDNSTNETAFIIERSLEPSAECRLQNFTP